MYARLTQVLAEQGGLVTRGQCLDAGLAPSRITQLLHQQELTVVVRGVYADAAVWNAAEEFRDRPLLRARAVLIAKHRTWVLSHDSAALVLGMPLLDSRTSLVHLTRPGYGAAWTRAGVAHHYARFVPDQLATSAGGLRHLTIARTAVDIGREHGELAGLVACDWALRQGLPRTDLIEAHLPTAHWPGVIDARAAVERADPRAESAAESLGRDLVQEALGVGTVDLQFPVELQDRVVWCDLRVGNHVIEVHGRVKLVPVEDGGLARTSPADVAWEQQKRARLIRARELGLSDLVWEDFWGGRRREAIARIRAEHETTVRRFVPDLPAPLARRAAELRDQYGWRNRAA